MTVQQVGIESSVGCLFCNFGYEKQIPDACLGMFAGNKAGNAKICDNILPAVCRRENTPSAGKRLFIGVLYAA